MAANMTTPRPHAELAARYYADNTLKCWTKDGAGGWIVNPAPSWFGGCEYHVGHEPPKVKRTITLVVNGREWVLPEPLREHFIIGAMYWSVDWMGLPWYGTWADDHREIRALEQGNRYATKADAQAWAEFDRWCRGGGHD